MNTIIKAKEPRRKRRIAVRVFNAAFKQTKIVSRLLCLL